MEGNYMYYDNGSGNIRINDKNMMVGSITQTIEDFMIVNSD